MRHQSNKIKFNSGRDANRMLMRKLAVSFLDHGYLQTTLAKAKTLKPHLEKLVTKMKIKNEANKNFLLRYLGDIKIVNDGFDRVGQALERVIGGYVRVIKQGMRNDDGAPLARVEWAYPVVKSVSTKVSTSAKTLVDKTLDKSKSEVKKVKKNEKPNKTDKIS